MGETFIALLAAHLLADFTFQPAWMVQRKRSAKVLGLHIIRVAALAILMTGSGAVGVLLILLAAHTVMDAIKVYLLKDTLASFLLDQAVHLAVIGGLAVTYPQTVANGWMSHLPAAWLPVYVTGLALLCGLIASLHVGAILIRKATAGFTAEITSGIEGLKNGGLYIGCLERALVMLLILIGQPAGVGFLITAKSILRFGDVKDPSQRQMTEYIIIGTFMSFGWGLLIAVLTQLAVAHWAQVLMAAP